MAPPAARRYRPPPGRQAGFRRLTVGRNRCTCGRGWIDACAAVRFAFGLTRFGLRQPANRSRLGPGVAHRPVCCPSLAVGPGARFGPAAAPDSRDEPRVSVPGLGAGSLAVMRVSGSRNTVLRFHQAAQAAREACCSASRQTSGRFAVGGNRTCRSARVVTSKSRNGSRRHPPKPITRRPWALSTHSARPGRSSSKAQPIGRRNTSIRMGIADVSAHTIRPSPKKTKLERGLPGVQRQQPSPVESVRPRFQNHCAAR